MIVLGVVLVVLAAVMLLVALLAASDNEVQFDLGFMEGSLSALSIFLLGAATVLIFVSGLELLRSGVRRSMRRRRELKQARAVVADHDRREQPAVSEQTSTESTSTSSTGSSTEPTDTSTPDTAGGTDTPGSARDR
jgi:hypothetical protein